MSNNPNIEITKTNGTKVLIDEPNVLLILGGGMLGFGWPFTEDEVIEEIRLIIDIYNKCPSRRERNNYRTVKERKRCRAELKKLRKIHKECETIRSFRRQEQ